MGTELRKFTFEELKQYDGKEGRPCYVAYKGKVYDVTDDSLWIDGDHLGQHSGGRDLSNDIELAPHGEEVLERVKLIGVLVQ